MPRINVGMGFAQVAFLAINVFIDVIPKTIGITIKGIDKNTKIKADSGTSATLIIKAMYVKIAPIVPVIVAVSAFPKPYILFWGSGSVF